MTIDVTLNLTLSHLFIYIPIWVIYIFSTFFYFLFLNFKILLKINIIYK